jgi:1,4-alpha-glucan branching enzyme
MNLIQLLLPLCDNDGHPFPQSVYLQVRDELTEKFGGITTYVRSPAEGLWKERHSSMIKDEIVIYEVMVTELNRGWWKEFRESSERLFRQESIVVRAILIDML